MWPSSCTKNESTHHKSPIYRPFWPFLVQALVAGVFVLGIGTGVTVDSAINTDPRDLASRDAIDRNAPNPNICQQYGSSAMVVDQRVFVTFNPFSLHVSQVRGGEGGSVVE